MYITITPQKLSGKYSQSSKDFMDYQYEDVIDAKEVVREIAKLEKEASHRSREFGGKTNCTGNAKGREQLIRSSRFWLL